jgi:hypothetical protein
MNKKNLTKKELSQIINLQWEERRAAQKIRSAKNSKAAAKWKDREKTLIEQAKSLMKDNIENIIKRQAHYLQEQKKTEKNENRD